MSGDVLKFSPSKTDEDESALKDRLRSGLGYVGAGAMMVGALIEVPRAALEAAGRLTGSSPQPDILKNDTPTLEALAEELAPSQEIEAATGRRELGGQPIPARGRVLGRPEKPSVPMSPREPATS